MRASISRRVVAAFTAVVLVVGMVSLTGVGTAGACEELQIKLPGTAVSYNADGDRFVDGVVTNDTSQTLTPTRVRVSWAERPWRVVDEGICSGPLAPGEWTSFHLDRPCGIAATWTPVVQGYALPSDADARTLSLTVSNVSDPTTDDAGVRTYTVTVTNDNAVPVSSLDVDAVERTADASGALVDALDSCGLPDSLAPGASADFTVSGAAPSDGTPVTDIHVSGLEQPALSLSADTTSPVLGSRVTFQLNLTHADGSAATGSRTLQLLASKNGEDWCDNSRCIETDTGGATATVRAERPMYYKAVYWGGDDLGCAESAVIYVEPQVDSNAPSAPDAPGVVRAHHKFKISGRCWSGVKNAGKTITIIAERKKGSKWSKVASVKTTANGSGTYSKSVQLGSAGTYRIRAYREGVGYTPYRSLKVTK